MSTGARTYALGKDHDHRLLQIVEARGAFYLKRQANRVSPEVSIRLTADQIADMASVAGVYGKPPERKPA